MGSHLSHQIISLLYLTQVSDTENDMQKETARAVGIADHVGSTMVDSKAGPLEVTDLFNKIFDHVCEAISERAYNRRD